VTALPLTGAPRIDRAAYERLARRARLLSWPRRAGIGAARIMVGMLGGMGPHLWFGQARYMTSEVMPLVLSSILLVARRPRR
jgi:hypothetical protein